MRRQAVTLRLEGQHHQAGEVPKWTLKPAFRTFRAIKRKVGGDGRLKFSEQTSGQILIDLEARSRKDQLWDCKTAQRLH